jgi:hypothetical protein
MKSTGREEDLLAEEARRILKAEMKRRGFSFKALAEKLAEDGAGEAESVQTLINKVNRGRFTFAFFLRAGRAMGVSSIAISSLDDGSSGQRPRDQ